MDLQLMQSCFFKTFINQLNGFSCYFKYGTWYFKRTWFLKYVELNMMVQEQNSFVGFLN